MSKRDAARLSARNEIDFKISMVQARKDADISQAQLADLLGRDIEYVKELEKLDSNPSLVEIRQYLTQIGQSMSISMTKTEGKKIYTYEEAKAMRDSDWFDPRNVTDEFKGMDNETIKSELDQRGNQLVVCCSNLIRDMNFGSVVRSSNGFGVREVVFAGRRSYDRRGAVGAQNYTHIKHFPEYQDAFESYRKRGYKIVAAEYDPSRVQTALTEYQWQPKTMLVFGEEGRGLEPEILDQVDEIVFIPMNGSVRSFNVACAATVMIYDYISKVKQ